MGLSPLLIDTYRRYKRDTKTFTQWLGTTARATGLIDKTFQDDSAKQNSGNKGCKKGKNRKPRKQVAAVYKVSVNTIIKLANAVKEADSCKVLQHIMNVLGDVINSRKGCAAWYSAHQTRESDPTRFHNEGHVHIIEVLEEVYRILSPLKENVKTKQATQASNATQITNLFDLLEVEECSDWNAEATWVPIVSKKVRQDSYEPESSLEDVSFALY